jgi:hypothetical protein
MAQILRSPRPNRRMTFVLDEGRIDSLALNQTVRRLIPCFNVGSTENIKRRGCGKCNKARNIGTLTGGTGLNYEQIKACVATLPEPTVEKLMNLLNTQEIKIFYASKSRLPTVMRLNIPT